MGIKVKKKLLFVMIINKYCMHLNFIRIKQTVFFTRRTIQSRLLYSSEDSKSSDEQNG